MHGEAHCCHLPIPVLAPAVSPVSLTPHVATGPLQSVGTIAPGLQVDHVGKGKTLSTHLLAAEYLFYMEDGSPWTNGPLPFRGRRCRHQDGRGFVWPSVGARRLSGSWDACRCPGIRAGTHDPCPA